MVLSLAVTVFVGIVSVSIYLFYRHKHGYWKRRGVPGPKPFFPYGNFPSMFTTHISDPFKKFYEEYKHLPYIGIYSLWYPALIVNDLDLIKNIMIKDMSSFNSHGWYVNEKVEPLSGNLFSLSGQAWKDMRLKLAPAFTSGRMKMMYTNMVKVAIDYEKYLVEQRKRKDIFEFRYETTLFTSENISNTIFGLETNSFQNGFSKIAENAHKMMLPVNFFGRVMLTLMVLAPNLLNSLNLRVWDTFLTKFFVSLVENTIKSREKNKTERHDFIQVLMQMKNNQLRDEEGKIISQDGSQLTIEQMAAQAFVFFQAGYDTSSAASSFTLFELSLNQNIQRKVRQEILETLERHGGECTYEAIMEMKYLFACIDETLRKYPTLNFIFRKCTEDYTIPGTDIVIEKNTQVFIPNSYMHMDPEYFEDPNAYMPERFLPENKGKIVPYTYMPFGEGPRICIGQRFGLLQAALGLIAVLKNFNVSTCEKTDIPVRTNISPITIEPLTIYLKVTYVKS